MRKIGTYEIFKLNIDRLVTVEDKKYIIKPLNLTRDEAVNNGELIKIQENQLTHVLSDLGYDKTDIMSLLVNVSVPTELKTKGEKMYLELSRCGFDLNNSHYVRFASGSGQIRRNTITFIREDLYECVTQRLLCGLTFDDFGNDFNAAKYNAYFGLNMSGCHLLPDSLTPTVCVVDDMEMIRPHDQVNHVTECGVNYITLPDRDYILSEGDTDFEIHKGKAIRKSDGVVFTIRHGIHKDITVAHYDEIENSPCINSFDGQGLMSPGWAERVSEYLEFGYIASELIIRAPWVKGLLATIDFHRWFAEQGIEEITDSFGKVRKIKDVDVIISKSQFKMQKVYKAKCADIGVNAWDFVVEQMKENNLRWGVVKADKPDSYEKALNYQYLEALDLENDDVEKLCERTVNFFKKLNSGDIKEIYKHLIRKTDSYVDEVTEDETEMEDTSSSNAPLFQRAIESDPNWIHDKYIRSLILKECNNKLNDAKLGKILVRGNYQFCVSDPIGQLEWIARNHCGADIDIVGVVPAGHIYSNYWLNAKDNNGIVTIMRSPLIDRNEIAKRKVIDKQERYFEYLRSGLILSIHDLTALGCGGCDFDGDILFSTNDALIAKGSYDFGIARPLYYELGASGIVGRIDEESMTQADVRGLNSEVGQISNKAAAMYAILKKYSPGSQEYNNIYNSIIGLGQIVGMEIDRIKTGVKPTSPLEWTSLQVEWRKINDNDLYDDDIMITSEEEAQGIYRHNDFVPDQKPYFLQFNYLYLEKDIKQLRNVFNRASIVNFLLKLDQLEELYKNGKATEGMRKLYDMYIKAYPVNDSDCIVNHIAHLFENVHFDLQRQISKDGRNMLKELISDKPTDSKALQEVCSAYDGYRRFLRREVKRNNTNTKDGKKSLIQSSAERLKAIRTHYRNVLIDICGSIKDAFDYVAFTAKDNEKNVWDLLGDDIIQFVGE